MMKLLLPTLAMLFYTHNYKWVMTTTTTFALSLISISLLPMTNNYSPTSFMSMTQLSTILIILTMWLLPLTMIASYSIYQYKKDPMLFISTMIILLMFLLVSFSVNSLLSFYIAFESTLIPTMFLIMRWGPQPERFLASMYMLMYTIAASLPLLISMLMIFYTSSSLSTIIPMTTLPIKSPLAMFFIIAFLVKLPLYSLHQWLPKAHVEAPVAGSMILAGILLKLGAYGLFLVMALNLDLGSMKYFLSSLAMSGACLTALICMRQTDMKALIAYASVSHMSLMLAAMLSQSSIAWQGTTIMLVAHGLTSSGLFASVNSMYENFKTRNLMMIKALLSFSPIMTLWWFLLLTSNMATPPFINLPAEMFIISSIASSWTLPLILLLMMLIFLTSSYTLMLFTSTTHGTPHKMLNPTLINSPRNHLLMIMHTTPLLVMITKMSTLLL